MAGKVLLNVYSIQVKNDLLSIFVKNSYEVLEVLNEHDMLFKYKLVKDSTEMYIHELDEKDYEASMAQLHMVDREKIQCTLIIHKYSKAVIDDALAFGVRDIIVLPMDRDGLEKKLIPKTYKVKKAAAMPKEPPKPEVRSPEEKVPEPEHVFDEKPLNEELIRADRGNYPLSLVLVQYSDMSKEGYDLFEDELRRQLRNTDRILKYDSHRLILTCPFTAKSNVVDVESKVREAYTTVTFKGVTEGTMYLYGVTYPVDGKRSSDLIRKLKDGIHDSQLFSQLEGTLNRLDQRDVRDRLRRNL